MSSHESYSPGAPEPVRRDDPIVNGERWRRALEEIAQLDDEYGEETAAGDIARRALGRTE